MPVCYDVFNETFLFIRVIDELTLDEAAKALHKMTKDPRFIPYSMNVLNDFTHGVIGWDREMFRRHFTIAQRVMPIKRTAMLATSSAHTYRVLQQGARVAQRMGRNVEAFDCPLAAMRWLFTDEALASIDKRCILHQVKRQRMPADYELNT